MSVSAPSAFGNSLHEHFWTKIGLNTRNIFLADAVDILCEIFLTQEMFKIFHCLSSVSYSSVLSQGQE